MTYFAKGNEIYLRNVETGSDELFLTVHPTTCPQTPEWQAETLAGILNEL